MRTLVIWLTVLILATAVDAATGAILFSFASGGSVIDAPSIEKGTVYWGSGYRNIPPGIGNNKVYAFTIPKAGK